MMLRTIMLDLGNVLLYFSHERMFEQMGALCGKSAEETRELMLESVLDFEIGKLNRSSFHRQFESLTSAGVDSRRLMRAVSNIFWPNESIIPILDQLKAAGLRLVLLSNTNVAHVSFIKQKYDVLARFDDCVFSYEVGAMKPDPPIYEAALKTIQCDPRECFYTDDIVDNVERARGFGLQAEVFIDTQTLIAHLKQRNILLDENG